MSDSDAFEFLMGTKNDSESESVDEMKNDNTSDNEVLQTDSVYFISETLQHLMMLYVRMYPLSGKIL